MPRKRIYRIDHARTQDRHGNLTAKFRMKALRKRKKLAAIEAEKDARIAEWRERRAKKFAMLRSIKHPWIVFFDIAGIDPLNVWELRKDFSKIHAIWKQTAVTLHTDHGGDHDRMATFNAAWEYVKRNQGQEPL